MIIKSRPLRKSKPKLYINSLTKHVNTNQQVYYVRKENRQKKVSDIKLFDLKYEGCWNMAHQIQFNKWVYKKVLDLQKQYPCLRNSHNPGQTNDEKFKNIHHTKQISSAITPSENIRDTMQISAPIDMYMPISTNLDEQFDATSSIHVINSANVIITKRSPNIDLTSLMEIAFNSQNQATPSTELADDDVINDGNIQESQIIPTDSPAEPTSELEVIDQGSMGISRRSPFIDLFHALPPNYPVLHIYLNGTCIYVSRFIKIEKDIVHFIDESEQMISIDCTKIDGVCWGLLEDLENE